MSHFNVYHEREDTPHCMLASFYSRESAQAWIDRFDPKIWVNKTMSKENLVIVESKDWR